MSNAELFLMGRKYLKIPDYLVLRTEEYVKIVYDLMRKSWAGGKLQYVIGCYSRKAALDNCYNTCVIADIHFLEMLADLEQWCKTKDNKLLESVFFKYLKNAALFHNDFEEAAFYEWAMREKGYQVPMFSSDDYKTAFHANLVILLHESGHFEDDSDDFETLFEENIVPDPHFVKRVEEITEKYGPQAAEKYMEILKSESKADFMGLFMLMPAIHYLTKEQIVEMYFRSITGNCFYKSFEQLYKGEYTDRREINGYLDRAHVIVRYLRNGNIIPDLDMKKVDITMLEDFPTGLAHFGEFMQNDLVPLVEEYKSLEETYRKELCREVIREENRLEKEKEYFLWPRETV